MSNKLKFGCRPSVPSSPLISPTCPSFIVTIYHHILHLLAMSSTSKSQRCEIPLCSTPIQVYCDRLQAQYIHEGLARMEQCFVEEIKLCKDINSRSKHEYLVAKVQALDASFFLAFERGLGEMIDKATHREGEDDTSSQAPPGQPPDDSRSSTLASLDSSFHRRNADDIVKYLESERYEGKYMLLRTLSFSRPTLTLPSSSSSPSGPLPSSTSSAPLPLPSSFSSAPLPQVSSSSCLHLYELAVLANTIHTTKPEYLLLSDNCYFYAGTIAKVLQERYMPALEIGSEAMDRRLWRVLPERILTGLKGKGKERNRKEREAGGWRGIEIYAGEKVNTAPLIEKFERDLANFKKPVCFLNVGSSY